MDEQEAGTESSQEEQPKDPSDSTNIEDGSESVHNGDERDSQEGRSGDALAWVEGPAFNSPIEEMPTLQWPDIEAEAEAVEGGQLIPEPIQSAEDMNSTDEEPAQPPDDLEDAMQWLEHLAQEQGTPIDEMPTLVSGGDSEQDLSAAAAALTAQNIGDTTPPPASLDSDPMAWLEQLAIDQDSPLEELPSVANRLLASEIVSQYDADVDGELAEEALSSQTAELDDALQYLEEQARAQGISLDDVSFDEVETAEPLGEDLDALDHLAVVTTAAVVMSREDDASVEEDESVEEAVLMAEDASIEERAPAEEDQPAAEKGEDEWDVLSEQIPDDPDDALAWLGELSEVDDSPESNGDRSALAKGAAVVAAAKLFNSDKEEANESQSELGEVADDQALGMVILEEMPDDPDEAMAWMEGLAGQDEEVSEDQVSTETPDKGEASSAEPLDDGELAQNKDFGLARAALTAGSAGVAAKQYRKMLDEGQGGAELIDELETAVAEQPEEPDLVQLLGDAYMQNGQMQKAMKTYNKGFDHL